MQVKSKNYHKAKSYEQAVQWRRNRDARECKAKTAMVKKYPAIYKEALRATLNSGAFADPIEIVTNDETGKILQRCYIYGSGVEEGTAGPVFAISTEHSHQPRITHSTVHVPESTLTGKAECRQSSPHWAAREFVWCAAGYYNKRALKPAIRANLDRLNAEWAAGAMLKAA